VQRALKTALAGRTSLVIAHRLSTIREADQILVVDDGRVVERGTHASLISAGGRYAALLQRQQLEESIEEDGATEAVTEVVPIGTGSGDAGR
jgi:ATP-binding cassette, subfamily B, bacterial